MKRALVSTGLFLLGKTSAQITCYSCTANFDSFLDDTTACWTPDSTTSTVSCSAAAPHTAPQCNQKIVFADGFPQSIERSCNSYSVPSTDNFETQNAQTCDVSVLESRDWHSNVHAAAVTNYASASCQQDCATANCNNGYALRDLNVCDHTKVSAADVAGKWCDFETGQWYCRSIGTDFGVGVLAVDNVACTATTTPVTVTVSPIFSPISCVQCNSETDSDCFTKTAATACETEGSVSCSAETVITYHKHTGEKLREAIVRGCSSTVATHTTTTPVFDQCHWTGSEDEVLASNYENEKQAKDSKWLNEIQLACVATCNPSNNNAACNVVPNGLAQDAAQEKLIRCVTFAYDATSTGNEAAAQSSSFNSYEVCQPGVTQCYSSVTYLDKVHQDFIPDPLTDGFEDVILTHTRGCGPSTAAGCVQDVWSASTNVAGINTNVKKYTCAETCIGDLCNNNNWPNRPKCYQSSGPGTPMACASPAHSACAIIEKNLISAGGRYKKFVEDHVVGDSAGMSSWEQNLGFTTTVERGCVHHAQQHPTGCEKIATRPTEQYFFDDELFVENCNYTCSHNGCNFGTGYSGSIVQSLSVAALVLAMAVQNLF